MKASAPTIAPLLRSDSQGRILAEVLLFPEREQTLTELARHSGSSLATTMREVDRLVASEFFTERRSGRNRYIRANTDHVLFTPMQRIVMHAYGPFTVLPPLLASLPGVQAAYVYGSWAARMQAVEGSDPGDIDVLIIGQADRAVLFDIAAEAEALLRREVNITTVTPEQWEAADDPFILTVRTRPLVELGIGGSADEHPGASLGAGAGGD